MAVTSETLERLSVDFLDKYLLSEVWSEPKAQFRTRVKPALLQSRTITGRFDVTEGTYFLPVEKTAFYVWYIGYDEFPIGLSLPCAKWLSLVDINDKFHTLVHGYGVNGKVFPKCDTYLCRSADGKTIYFASLRRAVSVCVDPKNTNNVYFEFYYDSDLKKDCYILSFFHDSSRSESWYRNTVYEFINRREKDCQLICYRNGVEYDSKTVPNMNSGEYWDFIVDKNIAFEFTVDLTHSQECPAFLSKKHQVWKNLIHIPRELNPDNEIITYNTCDFFARRMEGSKPYGLYIHRLANIPIGQVTHNDFSLPLIVADAYRDYLDEQEIAINVKVRKHAVMNKLIIEGDFIYLLYASQHSDDDIIHLLCGLSELGSDVISSQAEIVQKAKSCGIKGWSASELELSRYVYMFFDTPDAFTHRWRDAGGSLPGVNGFSGKLTISELLTQYVDALGLRQTASLLAGTVKHFLVTDAFKNYLTYSLPVLYTGSAVICVFYRNGKIIDPVNYSYIVDTENNTVTIRISNKIIFKANDKLSVCHFITDPNAGFYTFTPDIEQLYLDINYTPKVYQEQPLAQGGTVNGIGTTYNSKFVLMDSSANVYSTRTTDTGEIRVAFVSTFVNRHFMLQNPHAAYKFRVDISKLVKSGKTITIPLMREYINSLGETEYIPYLNFKTTHVSLNCDYLVKGVDYNIHTVKDTNGDIICYELIIQTMDHFDDSVNIVDIVLATEEEIDDNSIGFLFNNELFDGTPVNTLYNNLTTCHVDSKLNLEATEKGNYTTVPEGLYENGAIWEIRTLLPSVVMDFIKSRIESYNTNTEKIQALQKFFASPRREIEGLVVIEDKHRIYSSYVNCIIEDILDGKLSFTADPDSQRSQAMIKFYDYIKESDVVFSDLDQLFVDYYPQYVNNEILVEYKALVDYVIKHYLPANIDPSLHSVAEEAIGD